MFLIEAIWFLIMKAGFYVFSNQPSMKGGFCFLINKHFHNGNMEV